MPAKLRSKTYTAGSNAERTSILARIRRMKKAAPDASGKLRKNLLVVANRDGYLSALFLLENFLLGRNERYNARKGGLGR